MLQKHFCSKWSGDPRIPTKRSHLSCAFPADHMQAVGRKMRLRIIMLSVLGSRIWLNTSVLWLTEVARKAMRVVQAVWGVGARWRAAVLMLLWFSYPFSQSRVRWWYPSCWCLNIFNRMGFLWIIWMEVEQSAEEGYLKTGTGLEADKLICKWMEESEHGNGGSCIFYQFTFLMSSGIHISVNHSNCSNGVWGKGEKAEA